MRKVAALYGAGNKSLQAEKMLRRHAPDIAVPYLVEGRQADKLGREMSPLDGGAPLRVISPADLQRLYVAGECGMAIVPLAYHLFDLREIRSNLEKLGIAARDVYAAPYNRLHAPPDHAGPGLEPLVPFDEAVFIHSLDVHVVDHCNLRCKACAHFANCPDEEAAYDAASLSDSLKRLRELVPNIHSVNLLGGEPLLHPRLGEIVISAREAYPYASMNLSTNGILLEKLSPALLDVMRDSGIQILLSLTPPLFKKADSLDAFLRKWGGRYSIDRKDVFERRLTPDRIFDAKSQFAKCGHLTCLRGSRIGYCVIAMFTDYYNRRFVPEGAAPLPEYPGVDVFAQENGKALLAALQQPLELCGRCVSRDAGALFWEKWQNTAPRADDWFITPPAR